MIKPGQMLKNGATVIAIEPHSRYPGEWVILAVKDSLHPYVTWRAALDDGSDTYAGYYSLTLDAAINDFRARCR